MAVSSRESASTFVKDAEEAPVVICGEWLLVRAPLAEALGHLLTKIPEPGFDSLLFEFGYTVKGRAQMHALRAAALKVGAAARADAAPLLKTEPLASEAWISSRQAAELLGCSPQWVGRLCEIGKLVGQTVSGRRRVQRESVLALVELRNADAA